MSGGFHGPEINQGGGGGAGAPGPGAETQTGISGIANSEVTYTSGTVKLSGLGAVVVRSTTGQAFEISVPLQSVQLETQTFIGGIANSQTTYVSGTVNFANAGNVTIQSAGGQQIQISVKPPTQLGVSTDGNTFGTTGTVNTRMVFVGMGPISLSQSVNALSATMSISAPNTIAQSVQAESLSFGVSTGGNTVGDTGVATGQRIVLSGQGQVSLSQATGANSTTVGISVPNSHAIQTGISSIAGSDATYTSGQVQFTGSNMVTVRSSLNQRIVIDATQVPQTVQAESFSMGVSTGGNTAGDTGVNTGTRFVFSGQANITLSQATAAGATTLGISAPNAAAGAANVYSWWDNYDAAPSTAYQSLEQGKPAFWPLCPGGDEMFPGNMTVSTLMLDLSGAVSSGAAWTRNWRIGIYTYSNTSRMDLLMSASKSIGTGAANASMSSSWGGLRFLTFNSTEWSNSAGPQTLSFNAGSVYVLAIHNFSSSGSQTFNVAAAPLPLNLSGTQRSGVFGQNATTNVTVGAGRVWLGMSVISFNSNLPASVHKSDIHMQSSNISFVPHLILNNRGSLM